MTPSRRTLFCSLLAVLAVGCGQPDPGRGDAAVPIGGESGTELAARQVLHRGNGAEPQSLDPHKSEGVPEAHLQRDLYEGLTNDSGIDGLEPGAASSWQISEDGLVYVF